LDFNLNLQSIHLRRSGKLLVSIGEAELKIPWWLLLLNSGNAQINLTDLDIFVDHVEPQTNQADPKNLAASPMIKVELPSYMSEAKYTLRAKNVSIRDIQSARRYFVVSKLLMREFQYGKNSAFEINIPVSIKNGETQYNSDLWFFGDLTPDPSMWNLKFRGEFRTRESNEKFKIEDLQFDGKAKFSPQSLAISSEIQMQIEKAAVGRGDIQASQEGLNVTIQLTKFPVEYFQFAYEDIKNPFLPELDGNGIGEIKYALA
jgi:hypothetical protein